jgi:hypothetical protein
MWRYFAQPSESDHTEQNCDHYESEDDDHY